MSLACFFRCAEYATLWLVGTPTMGESIKEMAIQKLNYIHFNPLQNHWVLCTQPTEYRFSSAIFYEQNVDEFGLLSHFCEVF